MDPETFGAAFDRLHANVELVVRGKSSVVELALVCFLAEGHLLLEDVPGTGKTSLARALAASLGGSTQRIQFTPDLLPSDVTGTSVYHQKDQTFHFHQGAVFANVVVADEINRASPRTQAALLEVMEERQVTVDATSWLVPEPFIVVATQNPIDMDGTYALPEAQLDRFLMRLAVGYPALDDEVDVLVTHSSGNVLASLEPVSSDAEFRTMADAAQEAFIADDLRNYLVRVVAATRDVPGVRLGATPRASVAMQRACRVLAYSQGRDYVIPEDIQLLAQPVLGHRLLLTPDALLAGRNVDDVLSQVLADVPVPAVGARAFEPA